MTFYISAGFQILINERILITQAFILGFQAKPLPYENFNDLIGCEECN